MENDKFLNEQIITYIGNKRLLLKNIEAQVLKIQQKLNKTKTVNADLFSGSGIVARMLKQYSSVLYVNDFEKYCYVLNKCYLTNQKDFNEKAYNFYYQQLQQELSSNLISGILTNNYAPTFDDQITINDRVFYTKHNAQIIDTIRNYIKKLPLEIQPFFLAPLLYQASVHVNTAGIFKGFYKDKQTKIGKFGGTAENALARITKDIVLDQPIFSNYSCQVEITCQDAIEVAKQYHDFDIVYLDPPYNQHPYGSNYFMLNVIVENKLPAEISKISGIPIDWQRSNYNKKSKIYQELETLIATIDSKYLILSYSSDGFLTLNDITTILEKYGDYEVEQISYNTYRGSRNLNKRKIYVQEYLFVLEKS